MGNSKRVEINAAIQNILAGEPYVPPKQSGARKLYMTIHESGMNVALARYQAMKSGSEYDLGESELNTLGYQLLYGDRNAGEAVAIFKLNSIEHPESSNAFDSLGEAYQVNGERDLAIASYKSALKLDPSNGHAAAMSWQLRLSRWLRFCIIGAVGVLALFVAFVLRKRL
jgi:tetratricopeptide (TPR) repeat protein